MRRFHKVQNAIGWVILLGFLFPVAVSQATETEKETTMKVPPPVLETKPVFTPVERPMPSGDTPGTYQMRCWQRGQLLFSENNLSDPVVSALPKRVLSFNEKSDSSVHLVEVADSLCLIKRRKASR